MSPVATPRPSPLPGRDLSAVLTGRAAPSRSRRPIYFMTEDDVTSGLSQTNVLTGEPFDALPAPACIESVVTGLPTGADGATELWKLNHYYERLDEWNAEHGMAPAPIARARRRAGVGAPQPHRRPRGAPQPCGRRHGRRRPQPDEERARAAARGEAAAALAPPGRGGPSPFLAVRAAPGGP